MIKRRAGTALAVPVLLVALVACGASDMGALPTPSPTASPSGSASASSIWSVSPSASASASASSTPSASPSASGSPTASPSPTSPHREPTQITVGVSKTDDDDSYEVRPTALVRNDTNDEGTLGTVVLSAKSTSEPCGFSLGGVGVACDGSDRHLLRARVLLRSGGAVECSESQSRVWSGDGYEDIALTCDKKLQLSDVKSVLIESS
jgi:hypothetical protein